MPEPAWTEALDRLAPQTERGHSHLRLVWEPGEVWCPVERWMIYEMMPLWRAPYPDAMRGELEGPNPRAFGHYDEVLGRFVRVRHPRAPKMITQRQWLLYRECALFGRPIWVVQGTRGGNKRFWSDIESNLSVANGGPEEPPLPGELPYATPDLRTVGKLRALDLVERFGDVLTAVAANGRWEALDSREREITQHMAAQLWDWLDTQTGELELTHKQVDEFWDKAPAGREGDTLFDVDAARDQFIHETAGAAAL